MADGEDVGGGNNGGGRRESGKVYEGIAGSEADMGTMPSGVD